MHRAHSLADAASLQIIHAPTPINQASLFIIHHRPPAESSSKEKLFHVAHGATNALAPLIDLLSMILMIARQFTRSC
jgi:hypothetical protein